MGEANAMIEFNNCSETSLAENIYATQSDTTEVFFRSIDVVGIGEFPIILNAPYQGRISGFSIQARTGSGVFTIKIGGVNVTGLVGKALGEIEAIYTPTYLNSFNVDQDISIDITSAINLTIVSISVSVLREVGTATLIANGIDTSSTSAAYLEKISAALPQGFLFVDIPFGTTKLDADGAPTDSYDVNAPIIENLTDAVPDRIFAMLVAKAPTGIRLLLSAAPTTPNTIFRATIATSSAATNFLSAGGREGTGASVATTSFPLRGDGSGGAIAVTRQTGDAATGLATLNLFSTTPTYDAAKLTGLVNQTNLGTGSTGAGSKVLYDDQTYKTPPSGGNVATDAIFDTKGDLIVGTGPNTAVKLPVGLPDTLLISAGTANVQGMTWGKIGAPNFNVAYIDAVAATPSLRTLGPGAQQAAGGTDARIVGALQAANNLSEFSATFDDVRINLNFGTIVYEPLPDGGAMGVTASQSPSNKLIDANVNTITNLTAANFSGDVQDLDDPNIDSISFWDDSAGDWDWLKLGPGLTITGTTPSQQLNQISSINSQITAYITVLTDAEKTIYHPATDDNARTFTIDSNANVAYPIGTKIYFINDKNTLTIAITTDTMVLSGGTSTGSRTLATTGTATAQKVTSTRWVISGINLT